MTAQTILGIDPGTRFTGYGIITSRNKKPEMLAMGHIDLSKIEDPYLRLQKIYRRTVHLIKEYKAEELAIEAPFFGKNVQSMLKLGRAQGVAIAAALSLDLQVFEYSPRKIKLAVTGSGTASKEQVAVFLQNILKLPQIPEKLDATDGLATALCHYYQNRAVSTQNIRSWADFIRKNPQKIVK